MCFGSKPVLGFTSGHFQLLMNYARNKSSALAAGKNVFLFTLKRLLLAFGILAAVTARAHSPFDSSTRAIVLETTVEIALTVGMEAGKTLLQGAPPEAFRTRDVGPSYALPGEFAPRFFEVASGGTALSPDKVEARTDGLEFNIVLTYPRPAGNAMAVNAVYVAVLPSGAKSAFVMTDEMGNILATRIVSQENHAFEVALPVAAAVTETILSAPATTSATVAISVPQTNLAPATVTPPPNPTLGFLDFLKLGIEHILTGYDHLLFLCGLLVVCRKVGPMLAIITCFTLAHSLTLALAALDLVRISPRLTEPLIAATIVFVGIENFRGAVSTKTRCGLALGFGLIHGFGFATALRETGMGGAGMALVKPLLAFNLGVEIGQLAVAAVFLPALFALRKLPWFERHGVKLISAVVVLLGGYWLLERLA
jgi:hypothetical protein